MLKRPCVLGTTASNVVVVASLIFVCLLRVMRSKVGAAGNIYTPADQF